MAHRGRSWPYLFPRDLFIRGPGPMFQSWPEQYRFHCGTAAVYPGLTIKSGHYYSANGTWDYNLGHARWDAVVTTLTGTCILSLRYELTFDQSFARAAVFLIAGGIDQVRTFWSPVSIPLNHNQFVGPWINVPPRTGTRPDTNFEIIPRLWGDY